MLPSVLVWELSQCLPADFPSDIDLQCWRLSQYSSPCDLTPLLWHCTSMWTLLCCVWISFFLCHMHSLLDRRMLSISTRKVLLWDLSFFCCKQTSCRSACTHWLAGRVQQWPPPTTGIPVWWRAAPSSLEGRSADQQSGPQSPSGYMPASCQTALEGPEEELCHFPALWSKCIHWMCVTS